MSNTKEELKVFFMSAQKEAYHQGCIDTLNNMKKTLEKVTAMAPNKLTMDEFINNYIPKFIEIENKEFFKRMN